MLSTFITNTEVIMEAAQHCAKRKSYARLVYHLRKILFCLLLLLK